MSKTFTEKFSDNDVLVIYAKNLIKFGDSKIKEALNAHWRHHQAIDTSKATQYSKILEAIDLDNELELDRTQLQLLLGVLHII